MILILVKMVFHKGKYVKDKVYAKISVKFGYSFLVNLPKEHMAQCPLNAHIKPGCSGERCGPLGLLLNLRHKHTFN